MKTVLACAMMGGVLAQMETMAAHQNPSGYEEITVAVEAAIPSAIELRRRAEERRSQSKYLAGFGESSFLKGTADAPTIELSLGSANNAYPNLASSISNLERSAAAMEKNAHGQLTAAWNSAVSSASASMSAAAGRALGRASFIVTEPSVKVRAVGSVADAPADVIAAIEDLEGKRSANESAMVRQAVADMGELAKIVSAEFEKALGGALSGSFLKNAEGHAKKLNVKVLPSTDSGAVSLVEAMQLRRDSSEKALMGEILNLELRLVNVLNKTAKSILSSAASRM